MAVRDVIFAVTLITVLGLGFLILHSVMGTAVSKITAHPDINNTPASKAAFESTEKVTSRLDYMIFAVFIGTVFGIIITGWFIGGHPIFMFAYFIVLVVTTVISAVLSNIWEEVSQSPQFITSLTAFPITNHLMTYLPMYAAIIGIVGIIVMFAKPSITGGEIY